MTHFVALMAGIVLGVVFLWWAIHNDDDLGNPGV